MKRHFVVLFCITFTGYLLGLFLKINGDDLWVYITAITTVFWLLVAYFEFEEINKTTKADFIKKFNNEFFSIRTRELLMLFDYKALDFYESIVTYEEGISSEIFQYFAVKEEVVKQLKLKKEDITSILDKKFYSSYEIDDGVLGYFENIGSFEKKGLIDIKDVYTVFGWYIDRIWNNKEIKKYIESERKNSKAGDSIYEDFNYIFKKCDSYGGALLSGKHIWWWKLKWFFSKNNF